MAEIDLTPRDDKNMSGNEAMPKEGPIPVAAGRNGRWVNLGEVGVDSATMAITDPGMSGPQDPLTSDAFSGEYGSGVRFWSGFGDGGYAVWGWVADYGTDGEIDERLGQVVVTLIDDHDFAQWHSLHCPRCSEPCGGCRGEGCDACNWQGRIDNEQPCK